jgi:hypothetical protein
MFQTNLDFHFAEKSARNSYKNNRRKVLDLGAYVTLGDQPYSLTTETYWRVW